MKSKIIEKNISRYRQTPYGLVKLFDFKNLVLEENIILESKIGLQELFLSSNFLYSNTDNGEGILLNLLDKNFSILKNEYVRQITSNHIVSFVDNKTKILNIHSDETVFYPYKVLRSILYEQQKTLIIDLKSEKSIIFSNIINPLSSISFPLSTLGTWLDGAVEKPYQVAEFSEIYEKTLVCTMNNGGVLLLDIYKGEVKAFFKDAKVRGGVYQKEENSPIFLGLKHYTFIELNAETGEIIRQVDIQNELKRMGRIPDESPCWLSVGTSIYQDGLFYFYGDTNLIGVFDPITEKIIDYHEFEFDKKQYQQLKGGVENLQVKDGKIYCLDSLGNLYELER